MGISTHPISCTTSTKSSSPSFPNFSRLPSQIFLNPKAAKRRHNYVKILCAARSEDANTPAADRYSLSQAKLDRRNVVLLGLGGLYGAYNYPFALASPVPVPDISKCTTTVITGTDKPVPYSCCPPFSDSYTDYKIPSFSKLNVRPAAHAVDGEYLEKYKSAVKKMKELPADDPRNFYQQANVHCAYCNGAYQLAGKPYQVHFTWLFFPFHRWYLYFYERILQSLIDDPTFTLPYWNWDNPEGMFFPEIFSDESSPLYNENRNQEHRKEFFMDLAYSGHELITANHFQKVKNNLAIMYRQMLSNAPCPLLYFGSPVRGEEGNATPGMGTIEKVPHNSVHKWVSDTRTGNGEDMGNFYSAAKDPVFFSHHSNVDRMWSIWKSLGGKRKDLTDTDWLQTEFLFYDENKNLVKVKVEDCLDNEKLGYTFQDMPTPWKSSKPTRKRKAKLNSSASVPASTDVLPATLDKILTFWVAREGKEKEHQEQEEVLNLEIEYNETKFIRLDVFLNEDNDVNEVELDRMEYAGSFANLAHVPHEISAYEQRRTIWSLAITELLEDLGLEGEDKVRVTLVPKDVGTSVTVKSAHIKMVSC